MIEEVLRLTGSYLVSSTWWVSNLLVGVWNIVALGILWLVVGGFLSMPLFIRCGRWVVKNDQGAPVWVVMPLVAWLYAHLWVASAVWWNRNIMGIPEGSELFGIWSYVIVLVALWCFGVLFLMNWAFEE